MPASSSVMLELKKVGELSGHFWVASYQRGYRWCEPEVKRLLDDIWHNGDQPYCLQPVVVMDHEKGWELVDGQQRLTTIYLVFRYMKDKGLHGQGPLYSISYETRPGSQAYLEKLDPALAGVNIDYHHLFEAYRTIDRWFNADNRNPHYVATRLYLYLMEQVRVIWYKAESGLPATRLFRRLNVGRIPLTDAELVKAELLRCARKTLGVSDRTQELAAWWDVIERDLRDPDVWAFIADGEPEQRPTRISLILDTLAGGPTGRSRPRFHTFHTLQARIQEGEGAGWKKLWDDIIDLHAQILGWYDDRDTYHKVGFLVTTGSSFGALITGSQELTRSGFHRWLDGQICKRVNLKPSELVDLSYKRSSDALRFNRVLLLMNVETVRRIKPSTERYPFRRHRGRTAWSLEHIHAQNPEAFSKAEQRESWLKEHAAALATLPVQDSKRKQTVLRMIEKALADLSKETFERVAPNVIAVFSAEGEQDEADLHGISNLALLQKNHNSSLSNSAFEVKRQKVLKLDREGAWIPPCTRRVFLKYYADADAQQIHFWSRRDRSAYIAAMMDVLTEYLQPEGALP